MMMHDKLLTNVQKDNRIYKKKHVVSVLSVHKHTCSPRIVDIQVSTSTEKYNLDTS